MADEGWLQFIARRRTEGLATLERMARMDPSCVSWHSYLSHAYLVLGRDEDFLREALTTAELRGDAEYLERLRLAQQQFLSGGRPAMLGQLSSSEQQALASGTGSAVVVALYRALARDEEGMYRWLAVAEANHDYNLSRLRGIPSSPTTARNHDSKPSCSVSTDPAEAMSVIDRSCPPLILARHYRIKPGRANEA